MSEDYGGKPCYWCGVQAPEPCAHYPRPDGTY